MRTSHKVSGKRLILALLLVTAVIGIVRGSVGTFFVVDGSSMYPTFNPKDVVQTYPVTSPLERGNIVIVKDFRGEQLIKRIVGLPGETITIYRGFVYVGQQRVTEPYLAPHTYTFNRDPRNERPVLWRLKENQYFVLGDNRLESCDSRHYGPVERPQIHHIVKLPANAVGPEISGLMLSENGRVLAHGHVSARVGLN